MLGGPCQMDHGETPSSSAVASVKTLNALPACRWAWVARLNLATRKLRPPTNARMAPSRGSLATTTNSCTFRPLPYVSDAHRDARSHDRSMDVLTRSPPQNICTAPYPPETNRS